MEQARMRRRGTAVLLDFWLPLTPRGRRQVEPGRTLRCLAPARMRAPIEVRMLLSFQRPPRLLLPEGTPPLEAPGPARKGPPSGQQSLAHPPGVSNPRGRASVSCSGAEL